MLGAAMATTLLSVSTTPNRSPFSHRHSIFLTNSKTTFDRASKLVSLCSPSSTSVAEEPSSPPNSEIHFSGCKGCGKDEIENGCNGEGRIQGGIATYPGFGWWPIKAYRPCPGLVASGGSYKRKGQTMDEVAFGKVKETETFPIVIDNEAQSSKKKRSLEKPKR